MKFRVTNTTSRAKALRSAIRGEMITIPARSKAKVLDLAEDGHPDVPGLLIEPVGAGKAEAPEIAAEAAPAKKAKAESAPKEPPSGANSPAPQEPPAPVGTAPDSGVPAPWQKGLTQ